jgi:hypothetical protein
MATRSAGKSVLESILFLFLLAETATLRAQAIDALSEPIAVPVLGLRNPRLTRAVLAAVNEASRKLEKAECRQIYSDFTAASGRSLQQNLDATGRTGQAQLRWLIFYNASAEQTCARRDTVAATNPGSRLVHLCPEQWLEAQFLQPGYAAVLILHEELHSLGLGENPPSSREITLGVIARCGS